jgi:hypothetical protein
MRKVKRIGTILGILLTVTILISGSAVATWVYARYIIDYDDCTNITEILYADDLIHATIGQNPSTLGWVIVDLGAGHGMGPNDEFTVVAYGNYLDNSKSEDYEVSVGMNPYSFVYVGSDDDQENHTFTTPNYGSDWRYIYIEGATGVSPPLDGTDRYYGPEVDAVGWDEP